MTFEQVKSILEHGTTQFEASTAFEDGRINSINDEESIIEYEKFLFPDNYVEAPQARYWYDIALKFDDGTFYPINIKSTIGATADNISSKDGLFYSVTGIDPKTVSINSYKKFETELFNNIDYETPNDYYILVFFKTRGTFLFSSLKRIETLTINSNNLPFQCKWDSNLTYTTRSQKDQIHYMLNCYIAGVAASVEKHNIALQKYYSGGF